MEATYGWTFVDIPPFGLVLIHRCVEQPYPPLYSWKGVECNEEVHCAACKEKVPEDILTQALLLNVHEIARSWFKY